MKNKIASIFCTALLVAVVSCGGGGDKTVVTISPRPTTVNVGTGVTFTTNIQPHKPGLGVTWSLTGAGSLTNVMPTTVDFNAPAVLPATPGVILVTLSAVSQQDATATDSVTFMLQ